MNNFIFICAIVLTVLMTPFFLFGLIKGSVNEIIVNGFWVALGVYLIVKKIKQNKKNNNESKN